MVQLLGTQRASLKELETLSQEPRFRKATGNMIAAYLALQPFFDLVGEEVTQLGSRVGLVLGTRHGELEETKEYFKWLATKGVARPFLFQNSLHHSTLGFVTTLFGLTGPALTVGESEEGFPMAQELAKDLIEVNTVDFCFSLGVDLWVEDFAEALNSLYSKDQPMKSMAVAHLWACGNDLTKSKNWSQLKDLGVINE